MIQDRTFELGCKLIGLYFLVWAAFGFLGSLPSILWALGSEKELSGLSGLYYLVMFCVRVLIVMIGVFLIRKSSVVRRHALRGEDDFSEAAGIDYFTVGVRLYGVILVVSTIPDLLRTISAFLFLVAGAPYGTTPAQAEFNGLPTNFFVPITSILFGFLLLFRGELLAKWAFAERGSATDSDGDS